MESPPNNTLLRVAALAAVVASFVVVWPFAPSIVFAVWTSVLLRPAHAWIARHVGGRRRLAALITTILLVSIAVPVVLFVVSLSDDAVQVVRRVIASDRIQSAIHSLGQHKGTAWDASDAMDLVVAQSGRAWALGQQIAGTAARAVLGLVIAIAGVYALLVDGDRWYAWLLDHTPIARDSTRRIAGAVVETGRGLVFGILGAGLVQAVVATVLYVILDAPQPLALGLLTFVCSVIPAVGTAIVWLPLSIGLAVTGHETAAIVLFACGVLVIGTIDNVVRPYLVRRGQLELPTVVVAIAMFGGVATMGARGIVFGPLLVRVTKELLAIARESYAASARNTST